MMNRRGIVRFSWLGGLALVAAGIAGTARSLSRPTAPEPSPGAAAGPGVVCFGHVDVETGVASLHPLAPGRVLRLEVHEGQAVRAGAVLLRLDNRLAHGRVCEAEAALHAAQAQLDQAGRLPEQHRSKLAQQQAAIEAARQRLETARRVLARKRQLARLDQVDTKEADAAEPVVREAEAAAKAEQEKLHELRLADPAPAVARARAEVQARQAQLDQARRSEEECLLRAPCDGTVLRVQASAGDILGAQATQPAILFCPRGPRIVRAEIEQEFAAHVAVGQLASVQDDTTGGPAWSGRVLRLSDWYTHRRSILQEPFQFNDVRTLECLVALDSEQTPLRIGQRVRVAISTGAPRQGK